MTDTAFWVSEANKGRLAELFETDAVAATPIKLIDVSKQPGNDSGVPVRFRLAVTICASPRCWPMAARLTASAS
jgi:hypothetical protein